MPYIQIAVTASLTSGDKTALRAAALDAAAGILNKKREIVMVHILDNQALTKGEGDAPCAFCDVRVMGAATPEACDRFSQALSADIARIAHTAPLCVYLSVSELTLCYTDGKLPPGHSAR